MLAMARALIQRPKVLLVDEMSMGLAPLVVEAAVRRGPTHRRRARAAPSCSSSSTSSLALEVADDAAVLNRGVLVLEGAAADLRSDAAALERAYLGAGEPTPAS